MTAPPQETRGVRHFVVRGPQPVPSRDRNATARFGSAPRFAGIPLASFRRSGCAAAAPRPIGDGRRGGVAV